MRALVATGDHDLIEFADISPPVVREADVVVRVRATSVNRGELHRLDSAARGWRPGWDLAGTVVASPAPGLPVGTDVFGMAFNGSWAELVAVPANQLTIKPPELSWECAAALPIAGLTALRMLGLAGGLTGRRVLVTGAAGGVGRYAVQLAVAGGARVTAVATGAERAAAVAALGARRVVAHITEATDEFELVLESVGGTSLEHATRVVAPGGTVVSFGNSSRSDTRLAVSDFYPKQAALRGFHVLNDLVYRPAAEDLAALATLASTGQLVVDIGVATPWSRVRHVLRRLRARDINGKAVLRVSPRS